MISDRIKSLIRDFNPWWEGKELSVPQYRRHIFANIQKYMRTKQIIAIVGLRRVGKTVLMMQLIKDLIKLKEKNVFYFLFDELIAQNPEVLNDILDYYIKTVAEEGKKYIFLDEIHKVPYWQDVLKRFYDTREDIKFIVSGSASLQIKKSKESLAGRIFDFYMPILTFSEFLELNGLKIEVEMKFNKLKKIYDINIHKRHLLEQMFLEYLFKGAFPEIVKEEDEEIIKNYVRSSVVDKIILEDIPSVFSVKRKDVLSSVLEYCSKETSNLLDITKLASILNINYQTVKSYIFYLQNSFVIDIVYNYSKSVAKQLRKNKKVHIAHPSIAIAIMRSSRDILDIDEVVAKYAESIVFQHSKLISEKTSFWRTPQKEEVDIVLEKNNRLLPIEVKYKSIIHSDDLKSILNFMKKFKAEIGIVVTKNLFGKKMFGKKRILLIPIWLFLLIEQKK